MNIYIYIYIYIYMYYYLCGKNINIHNLFPIYIISFGYISFGKSEFRIRINLYLKTHQYINEWN